ncbi:hypothetical protein NL364_28445, partial [Klebsiella pneumoniae]|nr:hypothetical protein [Klebsiella pneumoniae]
HTGRQPTLWCRRNNWLAFRICGGLLRRCQFCKRLQTNRVMGSLALSWVEMYGHHAVGARAYRCCSAQLSHTHGDNAAEVINMFTNKGPRR